MKNNHLAPSKGALLRIITAAVFSIFLGNGYSTELKYTNNCPWPVKFALFYCGEDDCGSKCAKGIAYGVKHLDTKQMKTLSPQEEGDDDDIISRGKYYCFEDNNGESMQIHDYSSTDKGFNESDAIGFEEKDHVYACGEGDRLAKMSVKFLAIGLGQFNTLNGGAIENSYPEGQIVKVGGEALQDFALDFPKLGEHCQFYQSSIKNGKSGFSCDGPVDVHIFRNIKIDPDKGKPLSVAYVLLCSNGTGSGQPCPWLNSTSSPSSINAFNIFG